MNEFNPHIGFMVFNNQLKIHSCNETIPDILLLQKSKDLTQQIEKLLEINEKLNLFLQHNLAQKVNYAINYFDLELIDGSIHSFLVKTFLASDNKNQSFLHAFISGEKSENVSLQDINRNLKYNSINKLAPSVAHEIRNPLSTLAIQRQIVENLLSAIPSNEDSVEKINKSLKVLDSELERVTKLIDRFFNIARSGNKEPTYEDLNSILREVSDLVRQFCYENAIELELKFEKNIPFIYINRDQFILVLLNLIINAIEATPERGKLLIRSDTQNRKGLVYIHDTGTGLTETQKENIFKTNFTTKNNGSGGNLSEARQIIQNMNGNIQCESELGIGTTFIIELPTVSKF